MLPIASPYSPLQRADQGNGEFRQAGAERDQRDANYDVADTQSRRLSMEPSTSRRAPTNRRTEADEQPDIARRSCSRRWDFCLEVLA